MRKCFLIGVLPLLLLMGSVQAQESDRSKLDSLLNVLPTLKDTARIDCLHEIGVQYLLSLRNKDSTVYYGNFVYEESKKAHYIHGLAIACLLLGDVPRLLEGDNLKTEQMISEALKWFELTPNKKWLACTYWVLGRALTNECKYDKALTYLNLSYELAKKRGEDQSRAYCLETMTDIYRDQGEYVKLLETQQRLVQIDRKFGDTDVYSFHELWVLGLMYRLLEEYAKALPFWRQLFLAKNDNGFVWVFNQMEYAELLTYTHQYDSALYYYNKFDSANALTGDLRYFLVSKGEYYLFLQQYQRALPYFLNGFVYHQQANDRIQMKRTLLDIAKTYNALHIPDSAIRYAQIGLTMALEAGAKPNIRDAYEILYSVYDGLHQTDSSYFYYRNYVTLKEAVMNNQTRGKLATFEYKHQVETLDKEKQLQQQQLQQTALQKRLLLVSIISLLLIGFIIVRTILIKRKNEKHRRERAEQELQLQKLEAERTRAELQHHASELEMQALRSQMNPHFIFNCLNAINHFILNNEPEIASNYLTRFSRLIRMVLNHSQHSLVSLSDDLECLELYIQLEQLRFQKHFEYTMHYDEAIDAEGIKIPPMLIQPFVENAIWHGLMHKNGAGELNIELKLQDNLLCCIITDNGIGRIEAAALKSKSAAHKKSLGIQITASRLQLFNNEKNEWAHFEVIDLKCPDGTSVGTKVILTIPITVFQNPYHRLHYD